MLAQFPLRRAAATVALLVAGTASAASAQVTTQTYSQCGTAGNGGTACYAARLTLDGSSNTLTVLLQNNGPNASRITGFALFENPLTGAAFSGTLQTSVLGGTGAFSGATNSITALPAGFAVSRSTVPGLRPPNMALQFVTGGGITPCAGTNGGSGVRFQTCSTTFAQALQVSFTGVGGGVTNANQLAIAVRFQSVANAGNGGDGGSLRCISSAGTTNANQNNCRAPGGGFTGTIVNSVVPEPSTYALLATGLGALGVVARRRRQNV